VDCPRRFQLKYIEKLAWPALEAQPAMETERYMQQGATFHRLIQQYILGVPVDIITSLAEQDTNLSCWWDNFLAFANHLEGFTSSQETTLYPEISLTTPLLNFRLIGKYDLIAVSDHKIIIYDWKTARNHPRKEWIAVKLQTRVYPYLLAQSGSVINHGKPIKVTNIQMVYWYANYPNTPLTFAYDHRKFQEDQTYLEDLIREISKLEESPATLTQNKNRCRYCRYRSLCNRGVEAGSFDEFDEIKSQQDEFDFVLDFDQIAEIEY
jgi:CRISPR/Cas system-associated exonuclease Cas4 (RecB family)